ncbi:MAG: ankyrin repeat-containing protein [Chthonomonadaceae bacterium]|nr:ankyrin repeat-containing protein [Chthonomonadaceae bacterium]
MSKEQARKTLVAWLRALILVLLLAPPAWFFIQAGRQVDTNQSLFEAVRRNDANTVVFLLNAGADANAHDPLEDKRPMLQKIYDRLRGVPDPRGFTPLQVYLSAVQNDKSPAGMGLMHPGIRPENMALLQALLDHRADPNVRYDFNAYTPLQFAVIQHKDSTIQALLKHGAKIGLKDSLGEDALLMAVLGSDAARIRLLLDAGADINSRDLDHRTPLMNAAASGDAVTVKQLLACGADVNAKDSAGDSALACAQRKKSPTVVSLLQAAGAK